MKEGEVADLHQEMDGLSIAGKTATGEISQLKVNLCHEVTARSSRKEELARLREEIAREEWFRDVGEGLRVATKGVCAAGCSASP